MNENRSSGGPNVGLLLLIPAAAIVARAAMRHHRMTWGEIGETGTAAGPHRRHGRHPFAGPEPGAAARDGFRLPPRIEWMLDTWHTRAHQADKPAETASA